MTIPIQDLSFTKRPSGNASMHVTYGKLDIWFEGTLVDPEETLSVAPHTCLYSHDPYVDIEITIDGLEKPFVFTEYRDGTEITPEMMIEVLNEFIQHTKQVVKTVQQ